ncbi:type VII secretion protein EccB [Nocardioides sp. CN2-186]|uniref:type VII secretion protein EccB n=1 Tax=Nocardioides tweenelious TaxID=3156607 RepID=UPI0032B5BDA1
MATKKDLVEAYSFSRRRLVTAFVSGAPGGREVEPARPGRTIVGGLALAVLLAAGAAIAGVFSPTAPSDWKKPGLIISADTGASYVILEESDDPELRPVINPTSAQLILGPDADPTMLSQDTISGEQIGDDIGILGAPALPPSSQLIDSGWTACTAADHGIRVRVSTTPDVTPTPDRGLTVESEGKYYAIIDSVDDLGRESATVYAVPPQGTGTRDQTDSLLHALNLPSKSAAVTVPREWLNLFPVGAPLNGQSFEIDGFGDPPKSPAASEQTGAVIGDVLIAPGGDQYVVTNGGPAPLAGFAQLVYDNSLTENGKLPDVHRLDAAPGVEFADDLGTDTGWPAAPPTDEFVGDPCAQLVAEHDQSPTVTLALPGDEAGVGALGADRKEQAVDTGRGAYVLSGSWSATDTGSPFAIDSSGSANPLLGNAASQLGYADFPVVVVPDTWVKLFDCGVTLSQNDALMRPTTQDGDACT